MFANDTILYIERIHYKTIRINKWIHQDSKSTGESFVFLYICTEQSDDEIKKISFTVEQNT